MINSPKNLTLHTSVVFGTSGLRGLAEDMTDEICWSYVYSFLSHLESHPHAVAIAHDMRPSIPRIARACVAAIEALGAGVIFTGIIPTPALAAYALHHKIPAIMVTGSHIPFDRNGIKFYKPTGEISKEDEVQISQGSVPKAISYSAPLPEPSNDAANLYMQRYQQFFDKNSLTGLRIGVYEHSSVARDLLKEALEYLGAEVIGLGRTEHFVPLDTEAINEEDRSLAKKWVTTHQ